MSSPGGGGGGGGGGESTGTLGVIAENVIRITYPGPVYLSGILNAGDSSNLTNYRLSPLDGIGLDGLPPRLVTIVSASQPVGFPNVIDLTTDRPLSHWPARYQIWVGALFKSLQTGGYWAPLMWQPFYGLQAARPQSPEESVSSAKDIAVGAVPIDEDQTTFGAFSSVHGDYAIDQGVENYKKRCWRRIVTKPNGFAHLPGYGAGVPRSLKKLATPSEMQRLSAIVEQQIQQEPETVKARASIVALGNGVFSLRLLVRTTSWGAIKVSFGVSIT